MDPLNPPEGVHGPFTIAGQNRCIGRFFISFRMEICKEIIKDQLHEKPEYIETFMMTICCFDDPTKQEQVYVPLKIYVLMLGGVDPSVGHLIESDHGGVHPHGRLGKV